MFECQRSRQPDYARLRGVIRGVALVRHKGAHGGDIHDCSPLPAHTWNRIFRAEEGTLKIHIELAVYSSDGKPALSQFRSALNWPDGSARWLAVVFEATAGPGEYVLRKGETPQAPDLVNEKAGRIVVSTGALTLGISSSGTGWMEMLTAPAPNGTTPAVVKGPSSGDLVLTRHDGKEFRASLDGSTRSVVVEERGPVRACVRIEGQCRAQDGEGLFRYLVRCTAFRERSEVHLGVTWINSTDSPSEQLRDIRIAFPSEFEPERLVIPESGVKTQIFKPAMVRAYRSWQEFDRQSFE